MHRRLVSVLSLVVAGNAVAQPPTFRDVAAARFDAWTADGQLSAGRAADLVNRSDAVGDEAAALAAVHLYFRDHPDSPPLTRAGVLRAAAVEAAMGRRDDAAAGPHFEAYFQIGRDHIRTTSRTVFPGGRPSRSGVRQGVLGDCFVVAPVGAALAVRPAIIKDMIRPGPDGATDVVFADGRWVRVPPATDARVALASATGDGGRWLGILEEAFGRVAAKDAKQPTTVAVDAVSRGGDPGWTIALLTGHKVDYVPFPRLKTSGGFAAPGTDAARTAATAAADLRPVLKAAFADRRLVCAGTSPRPTATPGVVTRHAHAVVGYDPATDRVTVWNPWGNRFDPGGMAGLAGGFTVVDGEFTVTVAEFVQVFAGVSVETDRPAARR